MKPELYNCLSNCLSSFREQYRSVARTDLLEQRLPAATPLIERYLHMVCDFNRQFGNKALCSPHRAFQVLVLPVLPMAAMIPETVQTAADLGTGTGSPGLVLSILMPSVRWYLIEANRRRSAFLEKTCSFLGLSNVMTVNRNAIDCNDILTTTDAITTRAAGISKKEWSLLVNYMKSGSYIIVISSKNVVFYKNDFPILSDISSSNFMNMNYHIYRLMK